jgi:hypothetical protein
MLTEPKRGEIFTIPAASQPWTNAIDVDVYVTYARRSLSPVAGGACETVDRDDPRATGWYIEYRSLHDGPVVDPNTPGLHTQFVSDEHISA